MITRRVVFTAGALALLYFAVQLVYIEHLPLVMDEFDGANEAYQLIHLVPYRDYTPYKTVLGYYLQLPPVLLAHDPWTGLIWSKIWLASINAGVIFLSALALATLFSAPAALLGQLLLISVTTFLTRSSEIRVDMLTAWAGLASFLLLLNRRWTFAGVMAAISFLISQKGAYYVVAADIAVAAFATFESRERRSVVNLVRYNAAAAATLAAYLACWSVIASPSAVVTAVLINPGTVAITPVSLEAHWARTLAQNPLFYWGALAGIAGLIIARLRGKAGPPHLIAAVYGGVVFALCRWHKQPWPYFFVILIPTLMVCHVAMLDALWRRPRWRGPTLAVILLLGVAWPLRYMPEILARDHRYQHQVVALADAILGPQDTYIAGDDLLYDRKQAPEALRRLDAATLAGIREWPRERIDAVIREIELASPKMVIHDYRVIGLPAALRSYLDSRFDHLWSSIWIYAPRIGAGDGEVDLWFTGDYAITGAAMIDGKPFVDGDSAPLTSGTHRISATSQVRLTLHPDALRTHADPAVKNWRRMFDYVYTY